MAQVEASRGPAVKICGLMDARHALIAAESGADLLGMVFAPSRRRVSVDVALGIVLAVRAHSSRPQLVGVFVNESTERMLDVAEQVGLDLLQLSGDESPAQVEECSAYYPTIKAVRFPGNMPVEQVMGELDPYTRLDLGDRVRLLLDTYRPGEYGGTGETADWSLAAGIAERLPLILAGGLNPGNVGAAIERVAPWAVDVSSGVETGGVKDGALIREFISAASYSSATLKGQ
ncbi:MAG: phosphoribosylanthranilate isomerase [Chloroflexota bacterium]|nr:phosphoribosylanthranilate isomerase [Chloroflexota bacterium]MDQ5867759.1 phosphoribosylanthranilate isomerase [Chloroflexota bacterium]